MFSKTRLVTSAIAVMVGAAILATPAPAEARGGGYHGWSGSRMGGFVGPRYLASPEHIVPISRYRFHNDGYRRFGRYEPRWFGHRQWHRYTWFRHFHHHRWFYG